MTVTLHSKIDEESQRVTPNMTTRGRRSVIKGVAIGASLAGLIGSASVTDAITDTERTPLAITSLLPRSLPVNEAMICVNRMGKSTTESVGASDGHFVSYSGLYGPRDVSEHPHGGSVLLISYWRSTNMRPTSLYETIVGVGDYRAETNDRVAAKFEYTERGDFRRSAIIMPEIGASEVVRTADEWVLRVVEERLMSGRQVGEIACAYDQYVGEVLEDHRLVQETTSRGAV